MNAAPTNYYGRTESGYAAIRFCDADLPVAFPVLSLDESMGDS